MSPINFPVTYELGSYFAHISALSEDKWLNYMGDDRPYTLNPEDKTVTFLTEELIPVESSGRPRVLLLFSNPHPRSIQQGMFLSPSTRGAENPFWQVMAEAGWIPRSVLDLTPTQRAAYFVKADYPGNFELIFSCYYAFPTRLPEQIEKIFGTNYFEYHIKPDSETCFKQILQRVNPAAVITFNKAIFECVTGIARDGYVKQLQEGKIISAPVNKGDIRPPVFLTYPTGWRFQKGILAHRIMSLNRIKNAIYTNK